ncbi:uncharacterized protein [Dendrobates tinctorius]|uniref:uncharacterized protein n=1 Tax=Dendrobates tinctorius TaxID=92724 RepID=UPI003CCA5E9D
MSRNTFAFDDTTTTRILSQVTSSGDFLKTPAQETRTRDYERERRRLLAYDLHATTLAEYHKLDRIPRGLRSHLRPTLFSDKPEFCERFQQILNKCSLDIILLTIDFLYTAITETSTKIASIEEQLSSTLSKSDWQNLKTKTDKSLDENRKTLQDRKRAKFQRDADDYTYDRVYRWHDSSSTGSGRRNYNQRRTGAYHTDSDSSTGSSSHNRFLARRQPSRNNHQQTAGGDRPGGQAANYAERMTTRSQIH